MDEQDDVRFDGGSPRTRKQILYWISTRVAREPGVDSVRFEPSRLAPTSVVAAVHPPTFLGTAYPSDAATLEVWWSPRPEMDHFAIQWYERAEAGGETPDPTLPEEYTLSCGWHQDAHLPELGDAHFQEEYPGGRTERYGVTFGENSPRWIVSECLRELPDRLEAFRARLEASDW